MPLILLNKPFRVLSQFTDGEGRETLASYLQERGIDPAGRLDYDSEGLMLLTDDGALQARISQPENRLVKVYRVQVEGTATARHLSELLRGVRLRDGKACALQAGLIGEPGDLWPREPPIRARKSVPVRWIEIAITEGRMTAVGLPTLRLIRARVGPFALDGLRPGESRTLASDEAWHRLDESKTL